MSLKSAKINSSGDLRKNMKNRATSLIRNLNKIEAPNWALWLLLAVVIGGLFFIFPKNGPAIKTDWSLGFPLPASPANQIGSP